jgi:hypothetical protein
MLAPGANDIQSFDRAVSERQGFLVKRSHEIPTTGTKGPRTRRVRVILQALYWGGMQRTCGLSYLECQMSRLGAYTTSC